MPASAPAAFGRARSSLDFPPVNLACPPGSTYALVVLLCALAATYYTSSTPATRMAAQQGLKITARRSAHRGHADHGWLKSFHTFVSSSMTPT